MTLKNFREDLEKLMPSPEARPFTCTGSPLECRIFIVGLNPATQLERPFFSRYWDDSRRFDREAFESDYLSVRTKRGVRPRIEALVKGTSPVPCLETDLYATPSKKASYLKSSDKNTDIIEHLLKVIRPRGILVYTKEPIEFFQTLAGSSEICGDKPSLAKIYGQPTFIRGLPGPLWQREIADMESIGARMKDSIAPLR